MNINIKKDYKQTVVGIIPKNWKVKRLGSLCSHFKSGMGITSKDINDEDDYPVYGGNGLRGYTSTFTHNGKFLLIGRQGALCGNIQKVKDKNYISEHAIAVQTNSENDLEFLACKLEYFNLNRLSESSAQPGLAVNKLVRLKLPIPPLPEQKAIANCLSTWDKGIEKLSALIASKKEQKKGLMQGIFNGKLKVENGELVKVEDEKLWLKGWKEVRLQDISIRRSSSVQASSLIENSGVYNVYGASGFITKVDHFDEEDSYIGIVKDGSGVGNLFLLEGKSSVLGTLDKILPKNSNLVFLYNLLKNLNFEKYKVGGAIPHIYYKDYSKEWILTPSIEEQTAIAEVLTSVDKEIELLEKKLDSFKTQKKGLMQVLLTGEKRLV